MKVFNLTDISTPKLKQHRLENHTFAAGDKLVEPGQFQELDKAKVDRIRAGLQTLINIGAVSLGDQPPAAYTVAKEKAKEAAKAKPATTPATPAPAGRAIPPKSSQRAPAAAVPPPPVKPAIAAPAPEVEPKAVGG